MRNSKKISVIILAAGSSLRFGRENKLEACICGKSVLYHAVRAFTETDYADEIILVTKADQLEKLTEAYRHNRRVRVILGGDSRNASSLLGVQAATGELVVIHDGARPFVDEDTVLRCIDGAAIHGAVAAAMPATDTIKLCDDSGVVRQTTQRSNTWRTQSPQAFDRAALLAAYTATDPLDPDITDDCMVMEHSGRPVRLVQGSNYNIKITTLADLTMAEAIARELGWSGLPRTCCAIGQDSHRTSEADTEKPMILGGVEFAGHPALVANSDGDVVLHALTNAVSGITAENVLGKRADVICQSGIKDSRVYLRTALGFLHGRITHASFTIECDEPKISPKIAAMRESIGELLSLPPEHIGITATSGEGLTDFSRGKGISVFCIVTAEVY